MVFSSITFVLVFLPLALLGHLFFFVHRGKRLSGMLLCNTFVLCASLFFYAWGEPRFIFILLASMFINFHIGLFLCPYTGFFKCNKQIRNRIFTLGLILNLLLLGYFKYMNFFVDNGILHILNSLLPNSLNISEFAKISLPLGISFYTFQGISYIIDVYRRDIPACRSIIDFGCYLTMFPQLVAGPIVRYSSIAKELRGRSLSIEQFSKGAQRFIIGLAKKLLIADTLGRVADAAFSIPVEQLSPLAAWAGIVCYTLQIYYDFSGYSDMAIGIGRMLGFTFPENFNYPYIARGIQEFWRRWHLTLSGWFKDYLYIPLGGNRHGILRTCLNLLIVFALCGFWHGAGWFFLVWGLWHGAFLILERVLPRFPQCLPRPLQHGYALLVIMLGWVIFRANDATHALGYMQGLLGFHALGVQTNHVWIQLFSGDVYIALFLGALFSAPILPILSIWWERLRVNTGNVQNIFIDATPLLASILLLYICMLPLFGATYSAFIYFRF